MSDEETFDTSKLRAKLATFANRMNWKWVIITQAFILQIVGWAWCFDKWNIESAYRIIIPGIGTVSMLLVFHLILSVSMVFVAWAIEYTGVKSKRYFHIDYEYKDGDEPRYGTDGSETEDNLDAEDLDREKWFYTEGDPIYINIDRQDMDVLVDNERGPNMKGLTNDQITRTLDKYVPHLTRDPNWPADSTEPAPLITVPPEKVRDRVEIGHEPEGLPCYCYWVTYNRPAFHATAGRKGAKVESHVDCIEVCHVAWDREFRFKRRTIPGRGFNLKCPNTERKELAHVETLAGNLMVFIVTTSNYVRKEATRKIRPTDDALAGGWIKILTFLYNLRMKDLKWKDDLIASMRAENVAADSAVRNARLDVLVHMDVKRYQDDYERQITRGARQQTVVNNDLSTGLGILSAILGAGFVILLVLRMAGV